MALLWTICSFALSAQNSNSIPQEEREALIRIYNSVRGTSEELVWNLNADPSQWKGITIADGHVVGIQWVDFGLDATLPEGAFNKLPYLQSINISSNKITGPLPADIATLKELLYLQIGNNLFTGKLPDFSGLSKIEILTYEMLSLGENKGKVKGTLPDFGKLPQLRYFDCNNSNQSGSISKGIGKCTELISFDISCNHVSGTVPAELAQCVKLADLSLLQNELEGEFPDLSALTDLGNSDYPNVWGRFFICENNFTGDLPLWIFSLTKLKRIAVQENHFTGTLPEDMSAMTNLVAFYANKNELSGALPTKLPQNLEDLDLSRNKFTGSIPQEWQTSETLNIVHVERNLLSGPAPAYSPKMKNLEVLDVSLNNFSFADFKDWQSFAKDPETSFNFGVQRNFAPTERLDKRKGESVTLTCTLPSEQPGQLSYQWMNVSSGQPVNGGNAATLQIDNLSESDAVRYVCLVTTDYFGKDPSGITDHKGNIVLPMMASGFFDLYVDGKINSVDRVSPEAKVHFYPTRISDGVLHISDANMVRSVALYSMNGERVWNASVEGADSFNLGVLPHGGYLAVALLSDNTLCTQMITLE